MTINVSAANRYDLHEAVVVKDIDQIERLLQNSADINELGSRRYGYGSALHIAAREGYLTIARLLIEQGAEIDVLDRKDFTPLHNATWNGNLEMTKLLLDAGAEIEASTYDGDTPLTLAQNNDQAQVAEFILAKLQAPVSNETKISSKTASDSSAVDITGTYISEITHRGSRSAIKARYRKMEITLQQTGNKITGFDPSNTFKIEGTRKGDIIEFHVFRGNEILGVWEINDDATRLEGKWHTDGGGGAAGIWNLTKIE